MNKSSDFIRGSPFPVGNIRVSYLIKKKFDGVITHVFKKQVTDVKLKGSSSTPRNVSIREKELCSPNASSSSQSDKQEVDDNRDQNGGEFHRNENDSFRNNRIDSRTSSHISSIELQTYKPLMPLLPAEIDHVEETPPASIFVIEVDVNHVDSVHENMDEEVMENKDKG